jgi:UDP-galactopyranose mutase
MTDAGKRCLVIDKRFGPGGNCVDGIVSGINVHQYGPHIFHTSDEDVWSFITQFTDFNRFTYEPLAYCDGKLYHLPFNMNTFNELWPEVMTPEEAINKISSEVLRNVEPVNLEEQALCLVGKTVYEKLIKG